MQEIVKCLDYAPHTCTWELTLRYNLNCGHRSSQADMARDGKMSKDLALRVAGELAALECQRHSLSGGEPSLATYWTDVTEEASRQGVRVSREFVRQAKNAKLKSLDLSPDGLEAEHDRIRGLPGLYRNVQQLLDRCAAKDMPVSAVTTMWKGNLHHLPEMHELMRGKVYGWQLQLSAAMGNLRDRAQQIVPEDLLELIPTLAHLINRNQTNINVADNIGDYGPYAKTPRTRRAHAPPRWVGCYAECRHLGIQADGTVNRCLSMHTTSASEGNLHQQSLRDIWTRPGAFAYNQTPGAAPLSGFCATCQYASVCRDGCHSMRICENASENPFCYHHVATLAANKEPRRNFYVPAIIAPAALMTIFGIRCGDSDGDNNTMNAAAETQNIHDNANDTRPQPAYGLPDVNRPDIKADVESDVKPNAKRDATPADVYGIPDALPDSAYALPNVIAPDVTQDVTPVDAYGIPDIEADAIETDVTLNNAYGLPNLKADID